METLFKILLSPLTFALGFLWPLLYQAGTALGVAAPGWLAITATGLIALVFGSMAQFRGSWIWIK